MIYRNSPALQETKLFYLYVSASFSQGITVGADVCDYKQSNTQLNRISSVTEGVNFFEGFDCIKTKSKCLYY